MIQIFTRTMTPAGFGRQQIAGHCETVEQAREYCRHAGEWESGWVFGRSGWRGPNGRAYEFSDVGWAYKGQKLRADWSPLVYDVDGLEVRAMGFADLGLTGSEIVRRGSKVWICRDEVWRETKAKKYQPERAA